MASLSLLAPFFGVFFAYLLLEEIPNTAQWVGGGIILAGMVVGRLGAKQAAGAPTTPVESTLAGA